MDHNGSNSISTYDLVRMVTCWAGIITSPSRHGFPALSGTAWKVW
jgi:hypothetical protein